MQEIAPSSQFQLMVKSDGLIYAKGINYEGELRTGSYKYAYEPTKVVFDPRSNLANIITFSIGNELVPAQIDLVNHEVKLIVSSDTDLTKVRPNISFGFQLKENLQKKLEIRLYRISSFFKMYTFQI